MIDIDLLLTPIDADTPAGQDLRYDPVYDQISEARREDDLTLPAGPWGRQPKRADLPLVLRLTTETLARRSKDLWLAVWLGHALIMSEGVAALPAVLRFLLALQVAFPDTLHPMLEEGDRSARSAPLQWGMEQYAKLLSSLPSIAPEVSYLAYKATRHGASAEAIEDLDAVLASTSKTFFAEVETALSDALHEIETLALFCEEFYGDDGPSFVNVRQTAEEVHGIVAGLLRDRRELEPDEPVVLDVIAASDVESATAEVALLGTIAEPEDLPAIAEESNDQPVSYEPERGRGHHGMAAPCSRGEAMAQLTAIAEYLASESVQDPIAYLLLGARCLAHSLAPEDAPTISPSSELRLRLRTLRREERWPELMAASLDALNDAGAIPWLDVHRDIWMAATNTGAEAVAASALELVRLFQRNGISLDDCFEDGTPIASEETRQWLQVETCQPDSAGKLVPAHEPIANLMGAPTADEAIEVIADTSTADVAAIAGHAAAQGDLHGAVSMLMADARATGSRRRQFLRKLDIAKVCVRAGFHEIGRQVLEKLRLEIVECGVVLWEGPELGAEVVSLLLQCFALEGQDETETRAGLFAELCALDPVRALELQEGR